jgi:mRNA interferase HigB
VYHSAVGAARIFSSRPKFKTHTEARVARLIFTDTLAGRFRDLTPTSPNAKIFAVRVISRKKIREASADHPEWAASLAVWYKVAKEAEWRHFADVRQNWKNSDVVGTCVVFDIANNRCRLIAYIRYDYNKLFVLHLLSHADYDKGGWKNDCDCD